MSKENIESIKKILNDSFIMFSSIPVSGEYVEIMAGAKEKLRAVHKMVNDELEDQIRQEKDNALKKG